ncbi:flagellar protein FliT [Virgibacillus sediminis]|uniref:Flagellar protein FliT n=1 Tax=Virgibacillus sediminis TaxID=202260 RepID=A0ABV7A2L4_9BACI
MNRLQPILDATIELKELLQQEITPQNREEVVQQVNQLLDAREELMEVLLPPFTEEEQKLGRMLTDLNASISTSLHKLFAELKEEMKQVKKQKQSNRKYTNPYQNVRTMDGMYLDSKK